MKVLSVALVVLFVAPVLTATEPPQISCRMGTLVEHWVTTEQLALVIETRDQLDESIQFGDGVGILSYGDEGSLKHRACTDLDGSWFEIVISGKSVADGVSEFRASIKYLGEKTTKGWDKAEFGKYTSFVKADSGHVRGEATDLLRWAAREIDDFLKNRQRPSPESDE